VVREKYRRKGIGSALVRTAQELAQRRQMRRMVIEAQYKNAPAIHLALKLGFDFSGYNDQYYASPDIALFFTRILR
jgi:ribosomal protein S18 acetylase RimI-like enzyme